MFKGISSQLAKTAAGSSGLRVAGMGLSFVTSILLTRTLGIEGYGIYAYSISWVLLLNIVASLGCQGLLVREIAANQVKEEWGLIRGLLRWSNAIVFLCSITIAAIFAFCALSLQELGSETLYTLWIASALVPITALIILRQSALQGFRYVIQGQIPETLIQPILFIIFLGAVYLLSLGEINAPLAMSLKVAASLISFTVGALILQRIIPASVKSAAPEYDTQKWIPSILSLLFMAGAGTVFTRLDKVMLGLITGPEAVGLYTIALRGADFILMSQQVGAAVLGPHIAGLYASGDTQRLQALTTKSIRIIMAYAVPVSLMFIFLGPWFLSIFGSEFKQGHTVLIILCIGKLINASTGAVGLLLNMTNHERDNAVVIGVSAVLNGIFNLLLIPQWGAEGAAIATASASAIANLWLAILVYKRLKINCTIFGSLVPFTR